ncbi:hypothetical protein C8J57DRAFT_1467541 [Mycena rebaudengoi]|nr:hypothetical protein C8J57DRAFT_1467541 [Mycena rebaudengoi]
MPRPNADLDEDETNQGTSTVGTIAFSPFVVAGIRWQPSAQYLNQCRRNLSRPPRKLLVLDVEGTLCCLRRLQELTHKRRRRTSRVSIARPFLGPFLSYIFHPDTRNWLDVMAWSSRTRDIPLDVRVKNLESAWLQLRSRPEMRADDSDHFGLQPSSTTIPHAAYSTIFVDNNPENARFQPHNFVQLPKYSIEVRLRDVKHFLAESSIAARNRQIEAKFGPSEDSPKNWGFRQDDSKREERARPVASSPKSSPPPSERTYDNALLALVGVLDELKLTFNVGAVDSRRRLVRREVPGECRAIFQGASGSRKSPRLYALVARPVRFSSYARHSGLAPARYQAYSRRYTTRSWR